MSKVGRKPIVVGSVHIEVTGPEVHYKGNNASGVHVLPVELKAEVAGGLLTLSLAGEKNTFNKQNKMLMGLHRAQLANAIQGAEKKFVKELKIVGLGFKAVLSGKKLQFSLGYSHKIDYTLPDNFDAEVDKTGQLLTIRSANKETLGLVCSQIKDLRPPEPYKGTGIQYATETVFRKVGKAK